MKRALNRRVDRATLFAVVAASAVLLLPEPAQAQSSASPYTAATRYDAIGRVVGTIAPDPDGTGPLKHLATRTTYDGRGNVLKVETGELANWQSEAIAPANWTVFTVHTVVETTYDALNRKLTDKVSGVTSGVATPVSLTQYSYDDRGRLACTAVRMNSSAWGSLPTSACTLGAEGAHGPDRITRTIYDDAGQVFQVRKAVGTGFEIADVTYSYTANGKIAQVLDANGNRAELRYDGHDRQERWVFPSKTRPTAFDDASSTSALNTAGSLNEADYEAYTYDANGNRLTLRKRDGSVLSYQYDNLNRMTRKTVPSRADLAAIHTRDVFYSYDLQGAPLRSMFDSLYGPGIVLDYDGFGRLTHTLDKMGTWRNIYYEYDANGNRTRLTFPDGQYINFGYDGLNRADSISNSFATLGVATYNARGLATELDWTYGTAEKNQRSFAYDSANRLSSIAFDLRYSSSDVSWTYTRNAASQILTETQSNDTYSWDGHVNLARSYTTNGLNQYTAAGSAAFCYDANGNLTADGTHVYRYDIENRLVAKRAQVNTDCNSLSYGGTQKASLYYDPLGRLYYLRNDVTGDITEFVYDGNAMIAEYNGSGTMLRRYVHGSNVEADDPLIWYEGSSASTGARRYLHADPRGSIVAVANHQGYAIATNSYDEYGIPDTQSGDDIATKGRFRYTGQAWIPELGMYYYKARMYSPTLGRFLQTDPIGYEDQFNLYAYVANDPVNLTDPTGLASMGGCGSRITGVNSCGGSSYFAYEDALQAHQTESANAAQDAGGSSGNRESSSMPGRPSGESRADYFRRRHNISETPRTLLPGDLGPQTGPPVILEGYVWERGDTLAVSVTGLLVEIPSRASVTRQGLGNAVDIARNIGLNRVQISAWIVNPQLQTLVDRGAFTRSYPGTTIVTSGGMTTITIPVPYDPL